MRLMVIDHVQSCVNFQALKSADAGAGREFSNLSRQYAGWMQAHFRDAVEEARERGCNGLRFARSEAHPAKAETFRKVAEEAGLIIGKDDRGLFVFSRGELPAIPPWRLKCASYETPGFEEVFQGLKGPRVPRPANVPTL